jgi:predicted Co/Zn/Cd cation transporter (cation efflux family)
MLPSPKLKLNAENMTLKWATFICLSAHNASAMAEILMIKPQKAYRNLSKHSNVITFTPTADTVHVHVSAARIGKGKKILLLSFEHSH